MRESEQEVSEFEFSKEFIRAIKSTRDLLRKVSNDIEEFKKEFQEQLKKFEEIISKARE